MPNDDPEAASEVASGRKRRKCRPMTTIAGENARAPEEPTVWNAHMNCMYEYVFVKIQVHNLSSLFSHVNLMPLVHNHTTICLILSCELGSSL